MGIYEGQMENPCPRCGDRVVTLFISISPIRFYQTCLGCNASDFTKEEQKKLGKNKSKAYSEGR